MSRPARWTVLAAGLAAGALRFAVRPDAASPAGAALFLGEVLILLVLALRYAALVEGRPGLRTAAFLALLTMLVWAAEAVSMKTGFLGGGYSYGAAILSPGIGGVPLLVLLGWALFGLLSGSVTRVLLGENPPAPAGAPRRFPSLGFAALANGAVMLGIDLAVEWHFSGVAGFWAWRTDQAAGAGGATFLDGVPPGNFLLWFAVGCAVPVLERLAGAGSREPLGEARPGFWLRASPALGFALLLFAGVFLDLAAAAPLGALACGAGCAAVTVRLAGLRLAGRRPGLRVSG